MTLESKFQAQLIRELRKIFVGAIVIKNDANYLQGFPDVTILYRNTWAVLETKTSIDAVRQPNQEYYVEKLDEMSYASFVYPENKEQVLNELQQAFRTRRVTRLSRCK